MKRIICLMIAIFLFIGSFIIPTFAHSGSTDSNGGHYDSSTGEYHYHHGYSAHQHQNGNCPYDYDDRTGQNSGSSSSKSNSSTSSTIRKDVLFAIIAIPVSWLIFLSPIIYVSCVDKVESFFDRIRRIFRRKQSPPDSSEPEEEKQDPITPPNFKTPNPSDDFPPAPITKSQTSASTPHTTHQNSQATNTSKPTPLSTPTIPPSPPQKPPVSIPRPKIHGSEGHFSPPTSSTTPKSSTHTPRALPYRHQQQSTTLKTLKDYPEILNYNADFLTERQAITYAESITTSRGKRAVTEFYHYDDLTVHDEKKPYRVESGIFSANSLHYYETTLTSCTCPDHQSRHIPCKHMIALAIKASALTVDQEAIKKKK